MELGRGATMPLTGTPVPKREIITLILRTIPADNIRIAFKIQAETDLHRRLDDFTKNQLVEVLNSTQEGHAALEESKANYPLTSNPTLYLVSVRSWPEQEILFEATHTLAAQMSQTAVWFGSDRTVRSIYMIAEAREYEAQIPYIEIPLVYEKKVEYVISNPESEEYGEVDVLYSLEKAIIWYNKRYRHALLLCSDFQAVKPILYYGNSKFGINWQLPFLSEDMLYRLANGANPRTASFSRLGDEPDDELDVQAMTISDQGLGESRSYRRLIEDEYRQQTSGFYSSHPDLVFGGLGISRQYGRIWTPARLRKDTLLALSINLIQKTEDELLREADINLDGFIGYYRNVPIVLAGKKVDLSTRTLIEKLIKAVIVARRSRNQEAELEPALLEEFIHQNYSLHLIPALEIHCDNCGNYLVRCPNCLSPYVPTYQNQHFIFQCPNHHDQTIEDNQIIECECAAEIEVTFSRDIRLFPGAELLKTLHEFLASLENQRYDGTFLIIGNSLRLIPRRVPDTNRYSLEALRIWRVRAHIHQRNIPERLRKKYIGALNQIKEKCSRNGWHPTREICAACMNEVISVERIRAGDEICLPRLLGYAIDEYFDGIHHGREVADVRYRDIMEQDGEEVFIGLHLKSRERPRKQGLGRSTTSVKGLYTQYCYSTYLAGEKGENLNVIGISVPNVLNEQVIENFEYLANLLGFPLIILQEEMWLKILDACIEKAEVDR
jgi:hypothetical protein